MNNSRPPWEEDEQTGELATLAQLNVLRRQVEDLEAKVRLQSTQLAALLEGRSAAAPKPDNSTGDRLQSGKYAGKTREWVVKEAPD